MRTLLALLLCGMIMLTAGCAPAAEEHREEIYDLYFLEEDLKTAVGGGALRAEAFPLPENGEKDVQQLAEALITNLLEGPRDRGLKSPIPAGTTLQSLKIEGGRAYLDLSSSYGSLSGVGLTLADCAVTLTLTQLPEILSVKITVGGRELAYRDKQVFTARDMQIMPEGDVLGTVAVTLYFLNEGGALSFEERTLELYEGDTQVSAVVRAMENGPRSKALFSALPEGLRIRSLWLEEDVCYVNLSSALLETISEEAVPLSVALQALSRSLCSLETVGEVRFLVDGEFAQNYGSADVSEPYME